MSQHGSVIRGDGTLASVELRDYIYREALAAGWTLKPSGLRDIGMVWCEPESPDPGRGQE